MTANEFYGPELAQMRLAERQVLEAVEELQRVWKAQGRQSPVLYTSSRIKSPESMCRKLAQRGQPQTRQAALTRVRDAVGVRRRFPCWRPRTTSPTPRRMAIEATTSFWASGRGRGGG